MVGKLSFDRLNFIYNVMECQYIRLKGRKVPLRKLWQTQGRCRYDRYGGVGG